MKHLFRIAAIVLAIGLIGFPTTTQAATTGRLIGVVTDDQGAALPGVTVTITSPQLQGSRVAITNSSGEYEFPLLPPGRYRAEYVLSGLETKTQQNVSVALDQTNRVDARLSLGSFAEAITVTADSVVIDPTQTTVRTNLKEDHLKYASVGQASRDYLDVVYQAPGMVEDPLTGNPLAMGANAGQNAFVLDGVNSTDPVTHTFGANLVFDSIQEVSVQTLGKDAEYGKAVGALITVVTKSGGNQFSGSFDGRYTSDAFIEEGSKRKADGQLRFDKETQTFESIQPALTVGGPVVRDRAWFFAAYDKPMTKVVNPQIFDFAPGSRDFDGWNLFGKLTVTPLSNHTLTVRYTDNDATVDHSRNSSFYRPEADSFSTQDGRIPTISYDAVLTSKWLGSVQLAQYKGGLSTAPYNGIDTTGVVDLITLVRSVNYSNYQKRESTRDQFLASTTYYMDRFGTHAFKIGTDIEQNEFSSVNFLTGTPPDASFCRESLGYEPGAVCGAWIQTRNGEPFRIQVANRNPEEIHKGENRAFYAQDEWRPVSQLTARLGLRYETTTFDPAGDIDVPEFDLLQPRIGVAYDLFNNSNSVLHAFAGRIMDDNALSLPSFLSPAGTITTTFQLNAAGVYAPRSQFGGPTGNQVDPDLKPTYSDEVTVGFTQRIFTNTSLDVTGVYREASDIFEDTCVDQEVCPYYWLTNNPGGDSSALRNDYRGAILKVESRPYSWLSGLVSYTFSKSRGSVEYTQNAGADFDVAPDHFVNRFGYLSDDARHRLKVNGFVKLPFDFVVGANYNWDTGTPWNVTRAAPSYSVEFVEPRGSRRMPHFNQLDLQIQKDFQVGPVKAGLIAAITNVLSTEIPIAFDGNLGDDEATVDTPNNPTFGQAITWQRPRRYDFGIRFEF